MSEWAAFRKKEMDQIRRWWPVVYGGRVALLLIGEIFFALMISFLAVSGGSKEDDILMGAVIIPAMLLVILCTADTVPALRTTGEFELTITLPQPLRLILHRMLPAVGLALAQAAALTIFLALFLRPFWHVFFALPACLCPILFSLAAGLLWNLYLKGAGVVFLFSLLTLIPAFFWIGNTPLIIAGSYVEYGAGFIPAWKAVLYWVLCQGGLLLGSMGLFVLSLRRLKKTEKLLREK